LWSVEGDTGTAEHPSCSLGHSVHLTVLV